MASINAISKKIKSFTLWVDPANGEKYFVKGESVLRENVFLCTDSSNQNVEINYEKLCSFKRVSDEDVGLSQVFQKIIWEPSQEIVKRHFEQLPELLKQGNLGMVDTVVKIEKRKRDFNYWLQSSFAMNDEEYAEMMRMRGEK